MLKRSRAAILLLALVCVLGGVRAAMPQADQTYGPTAADETLWSIATKLQGQHPGATVPQIAWAVLRANPRAFAGGRVSGLRPGSRLILPEPAFVKSVPAAQAASYFQNGEPPPAYAFPPKGAAAAPALGAMPQRPVQQAAPSPDSAPAESAGREPEVQEPPASAKGDAGELLHFSYDAPHLTAPVSPVSAPAAAQASAAKAPAAPAPAAAGAGFRQSDEGHALMRAGPILPADGLYERLAQLEGRYAGDVEYDYLLGTAALDSGHPSEAVFALQRAVATAPNFAGARMDLGRAYFAIGDNESARREFETVRGQNPAPPVAKVIADYLDAIEQRSAEYRPQRSAFAEFTSGYDSNANGATDLSSFLGFTLDSRSVQQESPYSGLGLGAQGSMPLTPSLRATGDAGGLYRTYPQARFVDSAMGRLAGGLEARLGKFTLSSALSTQLALLDGEENNRLYALDLALSLPVAELWRVGAGTRFGQLRFKGPLAIQDVNQLVGGFFATGRIADLTRTQFLAALTAGKEQAQQAGSPFGRKLVGLRFSVNHDLREDLALFASTAGLQADYDRPFFSLPRKDKQWSASAGINWRTAVWSGLGISTQLTVVNNDSDVALYKYKRFEAGVTVRKEFK